MAEGTKLFEGYVQVGVDQESLDQSLKVAKQSQEAHTAEVNRLWMASQRRQVDARSQAVDQIVAVETKMTRGSIERLGAFDAAMERSLKRSPSLGNLGSEVDNVGGRMSKLGRVFLEGSRGVEDFASQIGPMGLSGALRASGNNISQMFSLISPMSGAIAGLGVAALVAGVSMVDSFSEAEEEAESLADRLMSLNDILDNIGRRREVGFDIEDMVREGDVEGLRERLQDVQREGQTITEQQRATGDPALVRDFVSELRLFDQRRILAENLNLGPNGLDTPEQIEEFANQRGAVQKILDSELVDEQVKEALAARVKESGEEFRKLSRRMRELQEEFKQIKMAIPQAEAVANNQVPAGFGGMAAIAGFLGPLVGQQLSRASVLQGAEEFLSLQDADTRVARAKRIADQAEDEIKKLRAVGGDPELEQRIRSQATDRIQAIIKEPKDEKERRQQFTGITDLSKQIQLALNPDRATKAAEKSAAELAEQTKKLERIAKAVENPQGQVAVVAPGN